MKLGILIEWERVDNIERLMEGLPEMTEEEKTDQVNRLLGKSRWEGYCVVDGFRYDARSPLFIGHDPRASMQAENALFDDIFSAIQLKLRKHD